VIADLEVRSHSSSILDRLSKIEAG
jgi:hypothetical protein